MHRMFQGMCQIAHRTLIEMFASLSVDGSAEGALSDGGL